MNDTEKSDSVVVPMKFANKGDNTLAEQMEGRPLAKGNIHQATTVRTLSRVPVSSGLADVRKAAGTHKRMQFTALLHHVTIDLLRESYLSLKRRAAPGIDEITWTEYGSGLENRLTTLHQQIHKGSYRTQPARRVFIPKADRVGDKRVLRLIRKWLMVGIETDAGRSVFMRP